MLHEQAQTLQAAKDGTNQALETAAELVGKLQVEATRIGYSETIGSSFAIKYMDAVVGFQEQQFKLIAEARDAATKDKDKIRAGYESAQRQLVRIVTDFAREAA